MIINKVFLVDQYGLSMLNIDKNKLVNGPCQAPLIFIKKTSPFVPLTTVAINVQLLTMVMASWLLMVISAGLETGAGAG